MFTPFRADLKIKSKRLRNEMTPAEKKLWFGYLRNAASQKFLRQRPMGDYIVDFYCAAIKLVIEVDGDSHFITERVMEYDVRRDEFLKNKLGLRVLRLSNRDVMMNFEGCCREIERWLS